jgi:hypothetical protein
MTIGNQRWEAVRRDGRGVTSKKLGCRRCGGRYGEARRPWEGGGAGCERW